MKSILRHTGMAMVILVSALAATHVKAQENFVFWPDADYDPAIPSVKDVLGYMRAYLGGLNIIFMNAILRGSAHARPVR